MPLFGPRTILRHIKEYLPRVTGLFSESPGVTAAIIAGDPQMLRITEVAHGRSAGDTILVVSAIVPNAIIAASEFTDPDGSRGLRFTAGSGHDLTTDRTATLSGFVDSTLNGTFEVYGVPSGTTFEILTGAAVPTLAGGESLDETWDLGPQGFREIDSIVDVDTYDVLLAGLPVFTTGPLAGVTVVTNWRISLAHDISHIERMYTKEQPGRGWLYLVMAGAPTSKEWNTNSDAVVTATEQNDIRLKIINGFALVAVFGTTDQLSGEAAAQLCWTDVITALNQVLLGHKFESYGYRDYATVPTDHGPSVYNRAYYAHAYDYEFTYEITFEQGFPAAFPKTRALRATDINAVV